MSAKTRVFFLITRILERLPENMNHLERLTFDSLNRNLKLFGLTTDQLKNSDSTSLQKKTGLNSGNKALTRIILYF